MTLTALPTPPSRQDPANFSARADAFLAALPTFVNELNSLLALLPADSAAALALSLASTAADKGSSLIDFTGRGLTVGGKVSAPRLEATATDDTGTPDAAFRVSRTLASGTTDGHGLRDQTTFARVVESYAAFDAAITSSGSGTNDHVASFQSRPTINRTGGTLTNCFHFVAATNLSSGALTNNFGLYVYNPTGAGSVDYNYGIYIPSQNKGTLGNWAIYVANTGALVYLGADTQVASLLRVGGTAQLIMGGATTLDYPWVSYNYRPTDGKYQAADVAVALKLDNTGFRFHVAASGTAGGACTLTELLQVKLTGATRFMPRTTPATPVAGDVYFDSGTNKLRCYASGVWNDLF